MRIRSLKPAFYTDEGLCSLSLETHFIAGALPNWADDEGYFRANPKLIAGALFAIRFDEPSTIVRRALDELSQEGWIKLGVDDDGRPVGFIVNFSRHQRVDRPSPSLIRPVWRDIVDDSTNDRRALDEPSSLERKGSERSGKETPHTPRVRGACPICSGEGVVRPKNGEDKDTAVYCTCRAGTKWAKDHPQVFRKRQYVSQPEEM